MKQISNFEKHFYFSFEIKLTIEPKKFFWMDWIELDMGNLFITNFSKMKYRPSKFEIRFLVKKY